MKNRIRKHAGGLAPHKYLSIGQQKQLRQWCLEQQARGGLRAAVNRMLVEVIMFTGVRVAELCELKLRDLPGDHGKNAVLVECGKGRKERTIVVPAEFGSMAAEFIHTWRRGARPGSLLFVSERGEAMSTADVRSKLRAVGRAAGIGRLFPHKLRHTYGTNVWRVTKDILFLQDQMGHADPRTTAIYAKTDDESRSRYAEELGSFSAELIREYKQA